METPPTTTSDLAVRDHEGGTFVNAPKEEVWAAMSAWRLLMQQMPPEKRLMVTQGAVENMRLA